MILKIIYNCKMLTSFKVKILPLHVSIRTSVLGRLEARNGTGSIRKEANIQCPVHMTWIWGRSPTWQTRLWCRCQMPLPLALDLGGVSAVPPSLNMTYEEDKPRKLASILGHNSATSTKLSTFCLPNFPHSISNGVGLYPYFPKWLSSSTYSPIHCSWIQSQISVCD